MEALQRKIVYSISSGIHLNPLTICNKPYNVLVYHVAQYIAMQIKGANKVLNVLPNGQLPVATGVKQ